MGMLRAAVLACLAVVCGVATAVAQEACTPGPGMLGVSRVLEIDTSAGPRFGFQYKELDLLADGEVVLTFDDGPLRPYTKPILDALDAHCTKATFFSVGRMALADPEMVQETARRGHTVGTHTWSHANLRSLTPLRARTEIELGFSAVQQAVGKPLAPFFRFPYLSDTNSMTTHLRERHIAIFSIDEDSKDYRTRDPQSVHRRVMGELARMKKGIILFHDIQPSTARALPGLLADLKAKGYRVVHLQPKEQVTTLPDFDAQAQRELERRRTRVAAEPLAKRALTWPMAEGVPTQQASTRPRASQRYPKNDWFFNPLKW